METHAAPSSQGHYLYSYIRSLRGYGNECNMIMFPYSSLNTLRLALPLLKLLKRNEETWLSKDILVLAYQPRQYAWNVRKFLHEYFEAVPSVVRGRCGYIRTAINLEVDTATFTRASILSEGMNS